MDPMPAITRRTIKHGGVWHVPIPGQKIFVVGDPDSIDHILLDGAKNYTRSEVLTGPIAADLGSQGLLILPDGEEHHQLRQIMNPFFARPQMGRMAELAGKLWEPYMEDIRQSKGPVKTYPVFSEFSVKLLMEWMFGGAATPDDITRLSRLAPPVFEQMFIRVALSMVSPRLGGLFSKARKNLDREVWKLIEKSKPEQANLISLLKQQTTDEQVRDQVFTILMAGFDSVAVVWAWTLRYLAKHPEVLQDLRVEVQEHLQGRPPTWEDVDHLPLLQATITEVTDRRMAFPVYYRGVRNEHWLAGKKIPAGATIVINLDARHQILESQGEEHATGLKGRSPYIPYGQGSRQCIGKYLAQVMLVIPLARMLQDFGTWEIPSGHSKDRAAYAMTSPPAGGAPMLFPSVG